MLSAENDFENTFDSKEQTTFTKAHNEAPTKSPDSIFKESLTLDDSQLQTSSESNQEGFDHFPNKTSKPKLLQTEKLTFSEETNAIKNGHASPTYFHLGYTVRDEEDFFYKSEPNYEENFYSQGERLQTTPQPTKKPDILNLPHTLPHSEYEFG